VARVALATPSSSHPPGYTLTQHCLMSCRFDGPICHCDRQLYSERCSHTSVKQQTNSLSTVGAIDPRRVFLTGGPSLSRYFGIKPPCTTRTTTASVAVCSVVPRLWDDMRTFFDGCSGTVCAVGGKAGRRMPRLLRYWLMFLVNTLCLRKNAPTLKRYSSKL